MFSGNKAYWLGISEILNTVCNSEVKLIFRLGFFSSRIPCQAGRLYKPFQFPENRFNWSSSQSVNHTHGQPGQTYRNKSDYLRTSIGVFDCVAPCVGASSTLFFIVSFIVADQTTEKSLNAALDRERRKNPLSRKHSWDVIQFHINLTDWPFMHAENSYDCNPIMMSLAVRRKIYEWLDSLDLLRQSRLQLVFSA